MSITIKSRWDDTVLYVAENASDVRQALTEAAQNGANLRGANLSGANLSGANLRDAYLSDAYLSDANLRGSNLSGAIGLHPEQHNDLRILLDQPGRVRAYKLVDANGEGPFQGGIVYELGKSYTVPDANTDESSTCGAGI